MNTSQEKLLSVLDKGVKVFSYKLVELFLFPWRFIRRRILVYRLKKLIKRVGLEEFIEVLEQSGWKRSILEKYTIVYTKGKMTFTIKQVI